MPSPQSRSAVLFFGGLALLVAVLALVAAMRRQQSDQPGTSLRPPPEHAPLLGPRDPNEAPALATFEEQGRRSGSGGSFYVFGIVKNQSPFAVDRPKVSAVLRDAGGKEVARSQGYAERELLNPGDSSPVKVLVDDVPARASIDYEASATRALYLPGEVEGLKAEQEADPKANFGTWQIAGHVRHEGQVPAHRIHVVVVIRNASGKLIGVESAYADTTRLEPGQRARFQADVLLDEKPAKVELSVTGRPLK